ncbi:LETM1-related biofilm-associated protein [Fluviicola sp.]|jgi:hypothetical protein|uniref:LETM1-related biofilm-associated protein n=1 Tax=Fluviicola sp. TaxID=1917219 RepID=UPI00283445DF|nr:LETM1-related biofilm-associated protein [Fluviicola sp.]MDR0800913.1 hypothetical protein [Fluviicola sp.]
MIAPGSKGWIAKYLQLTEAGELSVELQKPENLTRSEFNHYTLSQTGIIFGYPSKLLFAKDWDISKWTHDEQLTVLLFESLLFTHCNIRGRAKLKPDEFLDDLNVFYKKHRVQSLASVLTFFLKESNSERIERILEKRVNIPKNLTSTKSWISYFNNSFIYLDVILFEDFLKNKKHQTLDYQKLALLALGIISISAYSDGLIQDYEKNLFNTFLLSADLDSDEKELAKLRFREGISLNELKSEMADSWNFKRYLLDLSALMMHLNQNSQEAGHEILVSLKEWMNCSERDLDEATYCTDQFLLENSQKVSYLNDSNSMEQMLDSVSKRWIKILGRNKDKLAQEIKQSKELVLLIRKSATEELSKEEKEKVKTQFMDIAKSMPALAIFLLPGGALLLPIVLKIIPNLVPSAFKDNELDE